MTTSLLYRRYADDGINMLRQSQGLRLMAVAVLLSGCQASSAVAPQTTIPPWTQAEAALKSALTAWVERRPVPPLDGVRIELSDRRRLEGRRLASFEILGPLRAESGRGFAVRLVWQAERGGREEQVRYLVAGLDPIWIMRQDDLELLLHWEHAGPDEDEDEDENQDGGKHEP